MAENTVDQCEVCGILVRQNTAILYVTVSAWWKKSVLSLIDLLRNAKNL